MDKENIEVGENYQCISSLLNEAFSGVVIAKYENSCVVELSQCSTHDEQVSLEYNNRFVVSFSNVTNLAI